MAQYQSPTNWIYPTNLLNKVDFIKPVVEDVLDKIIQQNPSTTKIIPQVVDRLGLQLIESIAVYSGTSSDQVLRFLGMIIVDIAITNYPRFQIYRHPSGKSAKVNAPKTSLLNKYTPCHI